MAYHQKSEKVPIRSIRASFQKLKNASIGKRCLLKASRTLSTRSWQSFLPEACKASYQTLVFGRNFETLLPEACKVSFQIQSFVADVCKVFFQMVLSESCEASFQRLAKLSSSSLRILWSFQTKALETRFKSLRNLRNFLPDPCKVLWEIR